ncbi:MAG: outer membrane lipoprotein chaperone LolA [bacterium]|nr:outer membrane lipoprotein chaperone LolA [bacterium]
MSVLRSLFFTLLFLLSICPLLPSLSLAQSGAVAEAKDWSCGKSLPVAEVKTLVSRVSSAYREVDSLSALFTQKSTLAGFEMEGSSEGKVLFKKPGKMRWIYLTPEPQEFVSDGNTLWYYQPDFQQVTLSAFSKSFQSDLPVSFLLGVGELESAFSPVAACKAGELMLIELVPLEAAGEMERFWLKVDPRTYLPRAAKTIDIGGSETVINLNKIEMNKSLAEEEFVFQIPKGVDVIDRRAE